MSDMQSTIAQLNQMHEAVTGITQSTPERLLGDVLRFTEGVTPSKGKGKGKKMGSVRGSNGPTPAQTPTKSRSQSNMNANYLVDITNKDNISSRELVGEEHTDKTPALPPQNAQKENVSLRAPSKAYTSDIIAPAFHIDQKYILTPAKQNPSAQKDNEFSSDTQLTSQAKAIIPWQSKSIKKDVAPTEDDIIATTLDRSTLSIDLKSVPEEAKDPRHTKVQHEINASSTGDSVLDFKTTDGALNNSRETMDPQKFAKSTKKKNKKNKNKRGPIPDFAGQSSSSIETSPLAGQVPFANFTAESSTGHPNSTDSSAIDTCLSDSSFYNKENGSVKSTNPPATKHIPDRSDSETTLCNSPAKGDKIVSGASKMDNGISSTTSTPKQKSSGNHKSRKSSHAKNNSNQSTSSNESLRKVDRKAFRCDKGFKPTIVGSRADNEAIKFAAEPDHSLAVSAAGKSLKRDGGNKVIVHGQEFVNSLAGDKFRLDVVGPKAVPKFKSHSDLQKQVQQPHSTSRDHDDTQWPALNDFKNSSSASIGQKLIASSAVRPVSERIGVVVPAIPLNMERRRQL